MAANGPSLMPGSIPGGYSRGHPLLFHFLCAVWIKCFGYSNIALHSFPLMISVLCLIAIFEGCRNMFGVRTASIALLLVSTQVIFFVQASFVLPEVMVTLCAFLVLYYYSRDQLLPASLMLFCLFFTKESGLVFGAVISCDTLLCFFTKRGSLKTQIWRLTAVMAPTLFIGIFFLMQKAITGWYLLPLHSSLIHTNWDALYKLLLRCMHCMFTNDPATSVLFIFIAALGIIPAVARRNAGYLFLFFPAIIVYILTNKEITDNTGDVVWVVLLVLLFAIPFYFLFRFNKTLNTQARRFIILLGCCYGAYLFFSMLSVLTYRYLLAEIVLLLIFLAVCIETFIMAGGKVVFYCAIAGILLIEAYAFYSDEGVDDTDLGAFHAMKVQRDVVAYLEKANAYDKEITTGCFWETVHLIDSTEGFLSSSRLFSKISWDTARPQTDYAVFDNVCWSPTYEHIQKNPAFHLVYKTTDGPIWAEIYQHK